MASSGFRNKSLRSGLWLLCGVLICLGVSNFAVPTAAAQALPLPALDTSGHITVDGKPVPYMIRRLPVSSFPNLPQTVRSELESRGCLIPQSYEAHQPENVVHASLEQPGSADWAVLCSVKGDVSLMAFFASRPAQPFILATAPETEHLQPDTVTGVYGFNWVIDPASPERIHEAATGLRHRPALLDHDALADTVIDHRTVYHFYANNSWTLLDLPEK